MKEKKNLSNKTCPAGNVFKKFSREKKNNVGQKLVSTHRKEHGRRNKWSSSHWLLHTLKDWNRGEGHGLRGDAKLKTNKRTTNTGAKWEKNQNSEGDRNLGWGLEVEILKVVDKESHWESDFWAKIWRRWRKELRISAEDHSRQIKGQEQKLLRR